jgi:dihydrofolate reductase
MLQLSVIAAIGYHNVLGNGNKLLWHLPNDMRFFKNTTWGFPIIMGRKTFESIGSKPLPGRYNIVITNQTINSQQIAENVHIADSIERAYDMATATDTKEAFIIGGGDIYKQTLTHCNKAYITRVHANLKGDTFFPILETSNWMLTDKIVCEKDDKHLYKYDFETWIKVRP